MPERSAAAPDAVTIDLPDESESSQGPWHSPRGWPARGRRHRL